MTILLMIGGLIVSHVVVFVLGAHHASTVAKVAAAAAQVVADAKKV